MSSPTHPLDSLLKAPQVLLTIRTWACWEKAQWLTIGLPIFFLVNWALVYGFLHHFLRSVKCKSTLTALLTHADVITTVVRPPHYANPSGCFHVGASPIFVACWAAIMVYHAGGATCLSSKNHNLKPIFRPLIAYGYSRFPHT